MKKLLLIFTVVSILVLPNFAGASTVLQTTDFLFGFSGKSYSFTADQTATKYQVVLTDLGLPVPFDFLSMVVGTTDSNLALLKTPGTKTFDAVPGATTYFVNVLGLPGLFTPVPEATEQRAGLFGLKITTVPIPQGITLLLSGLFAMVFLRRKLR